MTRQHVSIWTSTYWRGDFSTYRDPYPNASLTVIFYVVIYQLSSNPLAKRKSIPYCYYSPAIFLFSLATKASNKISRSFRIGPWTLNSKSAAEFLRQVEYISVITASATSPHWFWSWTQRISITRKGQPIILRDRLKCDAEGVTAYGPDTHRHMGALARTHQIIFDYLAKRLNIQKKRI